MFNDADVEQALWEAKGRRIDELENKGICTHSSGRVDEMGNLVCGDCGKGFNSFEELMEAHAEMIG